VGSITFRPTEKGLAKLNEIMQLRQINQSAAINVALETWNSDRLEQRAEEPAAVSSPFSLPPFLYCPQDYTWYLFETLMAECPQCSKKHECHAWRS